MKGLSGWIKRIGTTGTGIAVSLEGLFIDRMDQNEEITAKFMNEDRFREAVSQHLLLLVTCDRLAHPHL